MSEGAVAPRELLSLTRLLRGGLASLRAAAETLQAFPGMDDTRRHRLLEVMVEEAERLGKHLEAVDRLAATAQGADEARRRLDLPTLLEALRRAIASSGLDCELRPPKESLELEVLVGPLERAMAAFATTLHRDLAVSRCRLSALGEEQHVLIDLAWRPDGGDRVRLHEWQGAALEGGGEPRAGEQEQAGLRPIARAHDGEAWFILDRDGEWAHVRLLLVRAATAKEED